jgi:hypothetical protein
VCSETSSGELNLHPSGEFQIDKELSGLLGELVHPAATSVRVIQPI